jgi:outer membrane protein assembly factor BamB
MKYLPLILLLTFFTVTACSSDKEEAPLPGERISIMDLQREIRPTDNVEALKAIKVPTTTLNKEWPQAGGYPHHAMQNLELGASAQLERIWSADIGSGSSDGLPITAQPVIANGMVFTLDTNSRVRAFHDQTGRMEWETSVKHKVEKESVISGGLAFDGNVLFVTSGYNEVLALNPANGEIYWRSTISAASRAAPTIKDGRVYITAMNNNVMALDASNGKVLWEYQGVGETTGLLGAASPAVDEGLVISAQSSGELVALRTENGSVAWQDALANSLQLGGMVGLADIRGLPVVYGDAVIAVSYGGKIVAINKKTGTRVWQQEISSAETPWAAGNAVYVLSGEHQLIALSIMSGEVLWIANVPKYEKPKERKGYIAWTGPVMAGGRLILTGTAGRIIEFDPADGTELTRWKVGGTINISPVVANGALYLLTSDGTLLAYR